MRERVLGFALGVADVSQVFGSNESLQADLASISRVVKTAPELAGVFGDPSYSASVRASLAEDLFSAKVGNQLASQLVTETVLSEDPAEVVHVIGELPFIVSPDFVAAKIGFTSTRMRIEGYALARLRLDSAVDIAAIEREMFEVANVVRDNSRLRRILSGIGFTAELRKGLLSDLFDARVSPVTMDILMFAVATSRVRDFVELLEYLIRLAAAERGRTIAVVRSARELTEVQTLSVLQSLERLTSRKLEVKGYIEPELLGGLVALVGDVLFDLSARHRLEEIASLFAEAAS